METGMILSRTTTQGAPSYGGVRTCGGLKKWSFHTAMKPLTNYWLRKLFHTRCNVNYWFTLTINSEGRR